MVKELSRLLLVLGCRLPREDLPRLAKHIMTAARCCADGVFVTRVRREKLRERCVWLLARHSAVVVERGNSFGHGERGRPLCDVDQELGHCPLGVPLTP